jgi:hypothetical protein
MKEKKQDTYSYKGWLNSDFFWKRIMAVYGHYILGGLAVVACLIVAMFTITLFGLMIEFVVG